MRLSTQPGEMVMFLGKNGYPGELEYAKSKLELRKEYEVLDVNIGSYVSSVLINGEWFNIVMFENVDDGVIPIKSDEETIRYFWVKYDGIWYVATLWNGGYRFDDIYVSDESCLDEIGIEIIKPEGYVDDDENS